METEKCECGLDVTHDENATMDENGNWFCSNCLEEAKKTYECLHDKFCPHQSKDDKMFCENKNECNFKE